MTLLEMTILGIVSEESNHAYNIEKKIKGRKIRERLNIGFSTIYAALKKLERMAYLESSFAPQESLPGRRTYSITEKGKAVLTDELKKALSQPQREQSTFETGLEFGSFLSSETLKESLSLYESELSRLMQIKVREITDFHDLNPIKRALLLRPLTLWQAERKWIRELMGLLK